MSARGILSRGAQDDDDNCYVDSIGGNLHHFFFRNWRRKHSSALLAWLAEALLTVRTSNSRSTAVGGREGDVCCAGRQRACCRGHGGTCCAQMCRYAEQTWNLVGVCSKYNRILLFRSKWYVLRQTSAHAGSTACRRGRGNYSHSIRAASCVRARASLSCVQNNSTVAVAAKPAGLPYKQQRGLLLGHGVQVTLPNIKVKENTGHTCAKLKLAKEYGYGGHKVQRLINNTTIVPEQQTRGSVAKPQPFAIHQLLSTLPNGNKCSK